MGFAESTSVSPERTKAEIESTLRRYGCDQFLSGWAEGKAFIAFRSNGRNVRFVLTLPDPQDRRFRLTPTGKRRGDAATNLEYEQSTRSRWRALLLVIKAKLESVQAGVEVFEEAFLAQIVVPGTGTTVGQVVIDQLKIDSGPVTLALPAGRQTGTDRQ